MNIPDIRMDMLGKRLIKCLYARKKVNMNEKRKMVDMPGIRLVILRKWVDMSGNKVDKPGKKSYADIT